MQEGVSRLPIGTEKAAEAEVDPCEDAVHRIGPQILCSEAHDRLDIVSLFHKERDDPGSQRLTQDKNDCPESRADDAAHLQHLTASTVLPRSRVLGGEGGDCREHGARHKEEEADDFFHNTDSGGHLDTPAVGDHGDDQEIDLDHSLLQGDRQADADDPACILTVRTHRPAESICVILFERDQPQQD